MKRIVLVSAAALGVTVSGVFAGAGSASASTCVVECGGTPPPITALQGVVEKGKGSAQTPYVIIRLETIFTT